MLNLNEPETRFTLEAVREAARLVRQVQNEMVSPALTKGDRSPVTVADFASQALIGRLIAEQFPEDALVAEEDSSALQGAQGDETLMQVTHFVKQFEPEATPGRVCSWIDYNRADSAPRFWTLDPIDGTKGFLRGDQYAVALALVESGRVRVGGLGCPHLPLSRLTDGQDDRPAEQGCLVLGVRGEGTWAAPLAQDLEPADFVRLQVSERNQPSQARILRSFESGHTNAGQIDEFAERLGVQAEPVRMDSQVKYAILAAGQGELMLRLLSPDRPDYQEKIWDQAAGSIVLEEAGGRLTDLHGRALDFTTGRKLRNNRGVLASNSLLHPAALQALERIGA